MLDESVVLSRSTSSQCMPLETIHFRTSVRAPSAYVATAARNRGRETHTRPSAFILGRSMICPQCGYVRPHPRAIEMITRRRPRRLQPRTAATYCMYYTCSMNACTLHTFDRRTGCACFFQELHDLCLFVALGEHEWSHRIRIVSACSNISLHVGIRIA